MRKVVKVWMGENAILSLEETITGKSICFYFSGMFRKDEELTSSQRGLAVRYVPSYCVLPWFMRSLPGMHFTLMAKADSSYWRYWLSENQTSSLHTPTCHWILLGYLSPLRLPWYLGYISLQYAPLLYHADITKFSVSSMIFWVPWRQSSCLPYSNEW